MSSKKVLKLRQSILKYNTELLQLKDRLAESEEANLRYNQIVIKKAICKKELDEAKLSLVQRFLKKFSDKQRKSCSEKKLICVYFK